MSDDKKEIADLRAEVKRLHKAHEVACLGGELLRDEINRLRADNERLREALRWYADPRNHFAIERRSPGDPDPAVVFLEEAASTSDGGMRARKALEAKP